MTTACCGVAEPSTWRAVSPPCWFGVATLARADVPLPGDVHLLATVGEEVDCTGARAARDSGATAGVATLVIPDPTDLDFVVAHKGVLFLEFVTHGQAAHG